MANRFWPAAFLASAHARARVPVQISASNYNQVHVDPRTPSIVQRVGSPRQVKLR